MPYQKDGVRQYSRELAWEKASKPERVKHRAARNAARAMMIKEGVVKKHSSVDVDHITPISKGGTNSRKNLRPMAASENRSVKRTSTNKMKGNGR